MRTMGLLALEGGALFALHSVDVPGVDWAHLGHWLDHVAPEDAVVAVVRLLALGTVWYVAATTVLYALANLSRLPGLIRGVRVLTLPGIRRVIDGVMVASLVAVPSAVLLTPAIAHAQTPIAAQVHSYVPSPAGDPSDPYVPTPAGPDSGTPAADVGSYEVKAGDNLWSIAAAQLAARSGRAVHELSEAEIRPVWLAVIEANAGMLASGDPDLIFLGEVLVIPAP